MQQLYFNVDNTCLYCTSGKKSEHFICQACGTGMCEECYNGGREHDEHCVDFHETTEDDTLYEHIKEQTVATYGYMCYACIEHFSKQLDKK